MGAVVPVIEPEGGHGIDCTRENRTVAELEFFGSMNGDLQPVGEVGGEVLAADGDHGGVGKRVAHHGNHVGSAAGDDYGDDAGLPVRVEEASPGRGYGLLQD